MPRGIGSRPTYESPETKARKAADERLERMRVQQVIKHEKQAKLDAEARQNQPKETPEEYAARMKLVQQQEKERQASILKSKADAKIKYEKERKTARDRMDVRRSEAEQKLKRQNEEPQHVPVAEAKGGRLSRIFGKKGTDINSPIPIAHPERESQQPIKAIDKNCKKSGLNAFLNSLTELPLGPEAKEFSVRNKVDYERTYNYHENTYRQHDKYEIDIYHGYGPTGVNEFYNVDWMLKKPGEPTPLMTINVFESGKVSCTRWDKMKDANNATSTDYPNLQQAIEAELKPWALKMDPTLSISPETGLPGRKATATVASTSPKNGKQKQPSPGDNHA